MSPTPSTPTPSTPVGGNRPPVDGGEVTVATDEYEVLTTIVTRVRAERVSEALTDVGDRVRAAFTDANRVQIVAMEAARVRT